MNEIELRIMVIDDNPAIHQDFIKVLTTSYASEKFSHLDEELFGKSNDIQEENLLPEFKIDTAEQGCEGVEKIKRAVDEGKPYALAFVDVRMPPGWDGIETIKRMWQIDRDIQVVICTAYSDYSWEETVQKLGVGDNLLVLKKPFDKVAVRQLACALTKKWILAKESKKHTDALQKIVAERTESLQQSLSLLRATIESSTDGILVVNLHDKIIDFNRQFVRIWGIPETIIEAKKEKLLFEYMVEKLRKPKEFLDLVKKLRDNINNTCIHVVKFKEEKIIECYSQPHRINKVTVGRVWSFRDITERAYLEKELEHQATHDSLTDLPNRVLLNDRIKNAIATASREKNYFAILFFDLDRFKLINDSLGHEFGDEALSKIAKRLSSSLRAQDTLARLGGDEFVMVIPGLTKEENVITVTQKFLNLFSQPFQIAGHEFTLTTSIGVSIYPTDGTTLNTLLKNADLAMYHAKEQGGNQFKLYTPKLNQLSNKQLQRESQLRYAIANQEFFLVYQPQFDIQTHRLLGMEALIRWQHPKKGVILPLEFIPIAEESGLIVPIGEWVMREVCKQMVTWRHKGLPLVRVAVNVATQQLRQANFAQAVKNILNEYAIEPKYLEIEITENVLITNLEVQRMIRKLKKIGVKIVLDDFGTGNSSLNYLKQIHIDRLKIDQSFIRNISRSRSDEVIIEAIIAMSRSLNFKVLAEGVETKNQIKFLKNQHCDEVQGFYLSKPLSSDSVEKIIKKFASKKN
ncbi:sensory box protein, GGDEF family protein, LssE [Legionella lansingensis]|uniref:cyclic-guanylate-specific phosphodiesterase n=1 Tax=Legionella lansingensis TaxID=45067 RepID=A0A0W0VYE8_9GAMM|nr:EAL domain-containing protein [Legionella lansingensis]KTD24726.1 GGDEF domain-containing sensory box protein [Legionella lansingensis]SNV53579.1 sensory box protein, GGDEF family protein, LssE [Legionella lansingensis]